MGGLHLNFFNLNYCRIVYCSYKVVECFKAKYLHLIALDCCRKASTLALEGVGEQATPIKLTSLRFFSLFLMDMILTYTEAPLGCSNYTKVSQV